MPYMGKTIMGKVLQSMPLNHVIPSKLTSVMCVDEKDRVKP